MPIREMPKFKAVPDKMLEIPQPAIGGLNLKDLEFEQDNNQSPYMLNVMYRNGAFGKRYGQESVATYPDPVYATACYDDMVFVHSGTKIYKGYNAVEVASGLPETKGLFIIYAQKLYYLISSGFYEYDGTSFNTIDSYVPDFIINAKPDGSTGGDVTDDLNILGTQFKIIYNGTENDTVYHVKEYNGAEGNEIIDWSVRPTILVDDTETNDFTVDTTAQTITFATAPGEGSMNVVMEFTIKSTVFADQRNQILNCKFYDTFGGANNSRLFLAGGGNSKYWWTQAYDISYFPENNFATLGNTEDDITGFGRQYNVLIVFKPREIYSVYSYTETSSTTVIEENIGLESFRSQLVNARIGCDAPNSIQLINNLLTWFNSNEGVCTLVSTNIQDERNVRIISRNIERTNNFGIQGVLDIDEDPLNIQSVDYNNRYFLVFPTSGYCFMWDYEISPYRYSTSGGETDPRVLDWFLFNNFYVQEFLKVGKQLIYACEYKNGREITVTSVVRNGNVTSTSYWTNDNAEKVSVYAGWMTTDLNEGQIGGVYQSGVPSQRCYLILDFENHTSVPILINNGQSRIPYNYSGRFVTTIYTNGRLDFKTAGPPGNNEYFKFANVMLIPYDSIGEVDFDLLREYLPYCDYNVPTSVTLGPDFRKQLIKLTSEFRDLDFDGDGNNDSIHSYYMTPFMQFGAVEMLKNIKNVYIQCRGDTNTLINMYYYTDDSSQPELEPEPIYVGGGNIIWDNYTWDNFYWSMNIWGNTFRRKCNIKKVQMASVLFDNNEVDRDMSLTHVGFQYQLVKYIR